jgi:hypothetical protein
MHLINRRARTSAQCATDRRKARPALRGCLLLMVAAFTARFAIHGLAASLIIVARRRFLVPRAWPAWVPNTKVWCVRAATSRTR